jgi:hypothetical protein
MKRLLPYVLSVLFVVAFAHAATGQETVASSYPAATQFKIVILGTRYYSDANTIKSGLSRSPSVQSLSPTVVTQKHVEYVGQYTGAGEGLISDVQGLALNRFEVESNRDKAGLVTITLRKLKFEAPIQAAPSTPPASPASSTPPATGY